MNRREVRHLQSLKSYPSVSLLMPAHRRAPENKQDPIRAKNLLKAAEDRLLSEFARRDVGAVLEHLTKLVAEVDWTHARQGLAVFASRDFGGAYHLPFPVHERVVVDQTFATRDLVYALNRSRRYWVVALGEGHTRLFEGERDELVEVRAGGFPMAYERNLNRGTPSRADKDPGSEEDERRRAFCRQVDGGFAHFIAEDSLSVAVAGVVSDVAFFGEVTKHPERIVAKVTGSHEKSSPQDLGRLVWPEVEKATAARRRKIVEEIEDSVKSGRVLSTLPEVWRAAHEGRGALLVVEEGYHEAARVDEGGLAIMSAPDAKAPGVVDDAVDELIETVLAKKGAVVFVEDGALARHRRIALALRY